MTGRLFGYGRGDFSYQRVDVGQCRSGRPSRRLRQLSRPLGHPIWTNYARSRLAANSFGLWITGIIRRTVDARMG